jgi:hypothetical protein
MCQNWGPSPIGTGNRTNPDLRVNYDRGHERLPDHVDMVVRLPELNSFGIGAHKIRVDSCGNVISDELT